MNRSRDSSGPPQKRFREDNGGSFRGHGGGRGRGSPRGGGRGGFRGGFGGGRDGDSDRDSENKNGSFRPASDFRDPSNDRHKAPPSRVLHVRGLREYATQNDLMEAVGQFGPVSYVMMIPKNKQALVEMENVEDAKAIVHYVENSQIYVCGLPAFFNFSTSDTIKRPDGYQDSRAPPMGAQNDMGNMGRGGMNMNMMNQGGGDMEHRILLFTIANPKYNITTEVMHTICSAQGEVLRIVVLTNQGVQALVEFDSIESARKAKQSLNGCDVYSGCCTLNIEYARPELQRLSVVKNDKETFDYTTNNPGGMAPQGRSLLGDAPGPERGDYGNRGNDFNPPGFVGDQGMGGGANFNGPNRGGGFNDGGFGGNGAMGGGRNMGGPGGPPMDGGRGGFNQRGGFQGGRGGFQGPMGGGPMGGGPMSGGPMGGAPGDIQPGSVLIIYGLAEGKFSCDKIFNLFCSYGNVMRIKILMSKEGGCMLNMSDNAACERAVMNLNNSSIYDKKLSVHYSKQEFVKIHPKPMELPDGTPSQKDYSDSRNNRFHNPDAVLKTRFSPPTKVLHFFNAPTTSDHELMKKVFSKIGAPEPARTRIFPVREGARSATGLIEFTTVDDAVDAMVKTNNAPIEGLPGKPPYLVKLAFSASPILDKPGYDDGGKLETRNS